MFELLPNVCDLDLVGEEISNAIARDQHATIGRAIYTAPAFIVTMYLLSRISSGPSSNSSLARYIGSIAEKLSSVEKDPISASQLYMTAKNKLCSLVVSRFQVDEKIPDISLLLNDHEFKQFVESPNEDDYIHGALTVAVALNQPETVAALIGVWKYDAYMGAILPPPIGLVSISDLISPVSVTAPKTSEATSKAHKTPPAPLQSTSAEPIMTSSMFRWLQEHPNTVSFLADVKEHGGIWEPFFFAWIYAIESGNMTAASELFHCEAADGVSWISYGLNEYHPELWMRSLVKSDRLDEIEDLLHRQQNSMISFTLEEGAWFGQVEVVAKAVHRIFAMGKTLRRVRKGMFWRAICSAATRGHARVLEFLLDSIAKLHISQRRQILPIHPLIMAAKRGFVGVAGVILEPTAPKKHPTRKEFYKALEIAALEGQTEFLDVMLYHRAISKDRIVWVSWLMACAASKGHDCVVRLLQRRIFREERIE